MTFTSSTNKTAKNYKYPTRCGFACSLKVPWYRGCRVLAPAFTHTISAISTGCIRIPGGQTLPVAGLHIVGAGRLLLYSHTQSAQSLPLGSEFLAATRRSLIPGCTSWVPVACSCIHTQNQRISTVGIRFLVVRRFLPLGCTSWVPCACSCIHTQKQRFHTQNQRNLYRWHPNSWRPDASCRQVAHRR